MFHEAFGEHLTRAATRWLEPPWKAILSSKALLVALWDLYPGHPHLLEARLEPFGESFVQKPLLGREGANIALVAGGEITCRTEGPYGHQPSVYQQFCPLPVFDGHHTLVGSWMVDGHACGMGIREDAGPITGNTSRFVPHWMG
jgi:glutathionylspermidine synthase